MVVTSSMLPLGTLLPEFSLPDTVSGALLSSAELKGKPALLMVICNHCPYVVRIKRGLPDLMKDFIDRGVAVVALSANDVEKYPADSPEQMKADAEVFGYPFPYLYDEEQTLAAALQAVCTPEFYLFGSDGKLFYRGRLDDSTPGNDKEVTGAELKRAVDALLSGAPPIEPQLPSTGCSLKWKADRVPSYVSA